MEDFKKNIDLEIKKTIVNYNNFLKCYKFSLALASLDNIKKIISNAKCNRFKISKKIISLIYNLEKNVTNNDFYRTVSFSKTYPYKISKPYIIIKKFNKN